MEGFRIVMPPGSNVLAYNNLENIINGNELTETSLSGVGSWYSRQIEKFANF
jgi:hypothetical protein